MFPLCLTCTKSGPVPLYTQNKIIRNESFVNEFIDLVQNETLILDDLLYLCKVNAVRHSYLYHGILFRSEGSIEKGRKYLFLLLVFII